MSDLNLMAEIAGKEIERLHVERDALRAEVERLQERLVREEKRHLEIRREIRDAFDKQGPTVTP